MRTFKTTLILLILATAIQINAQIKTVIFQCNFDCPSCETKVMKNIPYEKGIKDVKADYEQKLVTVEFKESKNSVEDIQNALIKLGYNTDFKGVPNSFDVSGNCGMCKEKIETAALSVEGVNIASWDANNKTVTVVINDSKANLEDIHKAIADVGYDTDQIKAKDEVYEGLHECCKYDRLTK